MCKCEIQWIADKGEPTPDTNEAIGPRARGEALRASSKRKLCNIGIALALDMREPRETIARTRV